MSGADLMDGRPIYDIKPYLTLADCHPEAVCGFAAKTADYSLRVEFPDKLQGILEEKQQKALIEIFVNAIFLYDDRMLITFNYKDGSQTVRFEDTLTADEAEEKSPDLSGSAGPLKKSLE